MNNIFKFATKELSQDAFLCWLANNINANKNKKVGKAFINFLVKEKLGKSIKIDKSSVTVKHQYLNIDVLIIIDNFYIIIEDKILNVENGNQIDYYKNRLSKEENVKKENIFTFYYKMYDEFNIKEKNVNLITRKDMLRVLKPYINNLYIEDYYDYLEEIEKYSKKIDNTPNEIMQLPSNILNHPYDAVCTGYYHKLEHESKNEIIGWNYADNKSGGTWWYASLKHPLKSSKFDCIYAEINLRKEKNSTINIRIGKKYKYACYNNDKEFHQCIKDKMYKENDKVKYYHKKTIYMEDNNKKYEYKYYMIVKEKIDIYEKIKPKQLEKTISKVNANLKVERCNSGDNKIYHNVAKINIDDCNLDKISKILNIVDNHLTKLKIIIK